LIYFCYFQNTAMVNNRPIGKNSPNLVTLRTFHKQDEISQ
jgi:hypothetical protein